MIQMRSQFPSAARALSVYDGRDGGIFRYVDGLALQARWYFTHGCRNVMVVSALIPLKRSDAGIPGTWISMFQTYGTQQIATCIDIGAYESPAVNVMSGHAWAINIALARRFIDVLSKMKDATLR
jgi:hypothetical protein